MNFRCSSSWLGLALLVWCLAGCLASHVVAQDQVAAKPAEAGPATNAQNAANLSRAKKDGLKQLEKDLSRSFHSFSLNDSMDSLIEPPPRSPVMVLQNPRVRELLERKKNWMSLDPDDLLIPGWSGGGNGSSSEDPFNWAGKRDASGKKSSLDQFYDNLNHPRTKGNKAGFFDNEESDKTTKRKASRGGPDQDDDSNVPSAVREREHELKKLLGVDSGVNPFTAAPSRNPFADLFGGANDNGPSKAELQAHKAYLQKYQELLSGPAAVNNGFNAQGGPAQGTPSPGYGGISTLNTLGASPPQQTLGVVTPPTLPVAQQDLNAKILNSWNPFYAPPKVAEPPRIAPLTTPVTEVPRRKF